MQMERTNEWIEDIIDIIRDGIPLMVVLPREELLKLIRKALSEVRYGGEVKT